jgi:hypothetical protein
MIVFLKFPAKTPSPGSGAVSVKPTVLNIEETSNFRPFGDLHFEEHGCYHKISSSLQVFRPCVGQRSHRKINFACVRLEGLLFLPWRV